MVNSEIKSAVPNDNDDDIIEIRPSDVVNFLKRSRRQMLLGVIAGAIIGAAYAFSQPNQYTAQVTVLPEIQTKSASSLGNLSSLAGLAGIDIGGAMSGSDAIRPELYPNVLQSVPFALALFNKPVYAKEFKRTQLLEAYLTEKTKPWIPKLPFLNRDTLDEPVDPRDTSRLLRMTKEQEVLAAALQNRVGAVYDKKTGVLSISSTMPDPVVAANVVSHALTYLTEYITTYRTEKSRREVEFLNRQVSSAKQRYQASEYALSVYRDQNRSVFLNTAKIEEQRIQAEFLLSQDLYNTLSKQLEMAKIKVQEETPVFKVLEPARVPLKKSGPNRLLLIIGLSVAGLVAGLVYAFVRRVR